MKTKKKKPVRKQNVVAARRKAKRLLKQLEPGWSASAKRQSHAAGKAAKRAAGRTIYVPSGQDLGPDTPPAAAIEHIRGYLAVVGRVLDWLESRLAK